MDTHSTDPDRPICIQSDNQPPLSSFSCCCPCPCHLCSLSLSSLIIVPVIFDPCPCHLCSMSLSSLILVPVIAIPCPCHSYSLSLSSLILVSVIAFPCPYHLYSLFSPLFVSGLNDQSANRATNILYPLFSSLSPFSSSSFSSTGTWESILKFLI